MNNVARGFYVLFFLGQCFPRDGKPKSVSPVMSAKHFLNMALYYITNCQVASAVNDVDIALVIKKI